MYHLLTISSPLFVFFVVVFFSLGEFKLFSSVIAANILFFDSCLQVYFRSLSRGNFLCYVQKCNIILLYILWPILVVTSPPRLHTTFL